MAQRLVYPFRKGVASRMMDAISETQGATKTQRSFLTQFLQPVLDSFEANENPALPVDISTPIFWPEFRQQFTVNWAPQKRDRIGLTLARFWSDSTTAEAGGLNPLLLFWIG